MILVQAASSSNDRLDARHRVNPRVVDIIVSVGAFPVTEPKHPDNLALAQRVI